MKLRNLFLVLALVVLGLLVVTACSAGGETNPVEEAPAAPLEQGSSLDVNGDGTVDESEQAMDLNGNGVLDPDEMTTGQSLDTNGDGTVDESEQAMDLNGNGVLDPEEMNQ